MALTQFGIVVDVSVPGVFLSKNHGFMIRSLEGHDDIEVPLDDIAAVIASTQAFTVTGPLMAAFSERGIPFVVCGSNFLPSCIMWPTSGHHMQQRRMESQVRNTDALRDGVWTKLVRSKVTMQAHVLEILRKPNDALLAMADRVDIGDAANIEAQAARRYWSELMGKGFVRDQQAGHVNAMLNYGYAVLRAATARAICAAGLHPGIGVFHRHPKNPMPLADDVMEPFRPCVDLSAVRLVEKGVQFVNRDVKMSMTNILHQDMKSERGISTLNQCIQRLVSSLGMHLEDKSTDLDVSFRLTSVNQ